MTKDWVDYGAVEKLKQGQVMVWPPRLQFEPVDNR